MNEMRAFWTAAKVRRVSEDPQRRTKALLVIMRIGSRASEGDAQMAARSFLLNHENIRLRVEKVWNRTNFG